MSLIAYMETRLAGDRTGPGITVKSPRPWPRGTGVRPRLLSDVGQYVYLLTWDQAERLVASATLEDTDD